MVSILCRHGSIRSIRGRLFPSLVLFGSFTLLGIFISALGPAIPSLSRDLGVAETSFGTGFSLRGLGYLLGSWCSSLTLPVGGMGHGHWLNDRMNRLGGATAGIGLFALALDAADVFWLLCLFCFCQGFCGGAIDAIANAAIGVVHGADVAPWMQALHFCFSAGALAAPAAVGRLGYRPVFFAFGLLSLPVAAACCLAAAATSTAAARSAGTGTGGKHSLLAEEPDEEPPLSADGGGGGGRGGVGGGGTAAAAAAAAVVVVAPERRDVEMVEVRSTGPRATSAAAAEPRRSRLDGTSKVGEGRVDSLGRPHERDKKLFEIGAPPAAQTVLQPPSSSSAAAQGGAGGGALAAQKRSPQEEDEEEEEEEEEEEGIGRQEVGHEKHEGLRSVLLPPSDNQAEHEPENVNADDLDLPLHHHSPRESEGGGGGGGGGKLPSLPLVGLLVLFFFLYVGIEVGFGAWVAVVVLRDHLAGEAGAALMASVFWGGITAGRLLAVPLAVRFSADLLVRVNLVGGVLSSVLLWFLGREGIVWAGIGAGLFGLFMASTYPLAMSLLPSAGYVLSDKNSSRFVIGGALGEMLVPAFIAVFLGRNSIDDDSGGEKSGQPAALYSVCVAVSALLVAVYGTWFSLLEAAAMVPSP